MLPSPAEIEATILRLLDEAGAGRTISPTDAARALIEGSEWNVLMPAVRRAAVQLARAPPDPNVLFNNAGIILPDEAAGRIDDELLSTPSPPT